MRTDQKRGFLVISVVGLALAASPAAIGQTIHIDIANPTLAPGESTLVTLSASYPSGFYAVAGVSTEVVVNQIQGELSDPALVAPMDGPGTSEGTVSAAGGIEGILAGQLNFPPAGIFADPSNPIAFHTFEYTWDGSLSGPVLLDIETRTSDFFEYVDRDRSVSDPLADITEGRARIVIPAPASALILGLGALTAVRRRRS